MDIKEASKILDIGDYITINNLKAIYKEEVKKWHPDLCKKDKKFCNEKVREITEAYKVLVEYCFNYHIPINSKDGESLTGYEDPEEFWEKKFGNDPHWGGKGR